MQTLVSRLWSAGIAVALGLVIAGYGLYRVPQPDLWLWLGLASLLLLLGAIGLLYAERLPSVSFWSVIGIIVIVGFGAVPLIWLTTLALHTGENAMLLTTSFETGPITTLLKSESFRTLARTSMAISAASAGIAVVVGAITAYPLARYEFIGSRAGRAVIWALLVVPVTAIAGPWSEQIRRWGGLDTGWGVALGELALAIPVATWALLMLFDRVPWRAWQLATVEGATPWQRLRRLTVPMLVPRIVAAFAATFVVVWNDLFIAATIAVHRVGTGPLAFRDAESEQGVAIIAVLWLIPALVALMIAARAAGVLKEDHHDGS